MVGFQAEQMHEKSSRKVFTFGKVYRKVNNIDRMNMPTQGNHIHRKQREQATGPASTTADAAVLS